LTNNQFNNTIHTTTQNGLLIIHTEENSSKQNYSLIKLFNESIISFFKKKHYQDSQQSIEAAFNYANKKMFYSSKHNQQFAGRKLNSLIVLIKDKKMFFGSVGKANLFIKNVRGVERLTPRNEDFEIYDLTEIKSLKSSDLEQKLSINTQNSPYYPYKEDILLITSPDYSKNNDDFLIKSLEKEENIENSATNIFKYYADNSNISKPDFAILRLNFKGGNASRESGLGFYYENILQKVIDFLTSTPFLIILALAIIALFVFALKNNLIF